MNIKIDHLSYSSISRFLSCPAMFKAYMTEKKPLPLEIQEEGRNRHSEVEKHLVEGTIDKSKLGVRLKNFCKRVLGPVTAVEAGFSLDYITFDIIGYIDAYSVRDNQAVIVDFKGYPGGHIDDLQLQIYALAVKQKHPEVEVIHCVFGYIPLDYYDVKTYFENDLLRLSSILSDAIDRIAIEERFEATPGQYCAMCGYVELCPAAKNFTIPQKLNIQSISAMANNLYALEALTDKAKATIKDYLLEQGIESLPVGSDSRYYLSVSTALRSGKFKSEKDKLACLKAFELVAAAACSSLTPSISAPDTTISQANEMKQAENIVAFVPAPDNKSDKIRMMDLTELMKTAGLLPPTASSVDAGSAIRERLGTNFITATYDQKARLKAELVDEIKRKSA